MILSILQYLHQKGYRNLLSRISQIAYFLKGHGLVPSAYYPAFRAYCYTVDGVVYLSMGPGWAYSFPFLKSALEKSYGYQYMPKPGDCVVDIGAGLGEETVIFAQLVGPAGRVFAVEANPATFNALNYLCAANRFAWVTPLHLAVYGSDGEVSIEDDPENYLKNTINTMEKGTLTVPAKTLDTVVRENNISKIDFLKSNIEGAEQFLIQGMTESVKKIRNVCISCHDFRHDVHHQGEFYLTREKVKHFLTANGFEISLRRTGEPLIDDYVYARRRNE